MAATSSLSLTARKAIARTGQRQEDVMEAQLRKPYPKQGDWRDENFAFAAYYFNQKTERADAGLVGIRDRYMKKMPENAHWHVYLLARLYWLYSSTGKTPRMGKEAERAIEDILHLYLSKDPYVKEGMWTPEYVWTYVGSENHHLQAYSSAWSAAHILKKIPKYKDSKAAGVSIETLARNLDAYYKLYFREKAAKGLLTEVASGTYVKYSLNSLLNIYDFADDAELKRLAGMFLNVYFADWAIEQYAGIRGGARHRSYKSDSSYGLRSSTGWFPFGLGRTTQHPGYTGAATTTWRPDPIVAELALAQERRGTYEYISRRPGLRVKGSENQREGSPAGGQLLRYTYHTPQFIMGMSMVPAIKADAWTAISSQNRHNAILFNGQQLAKIYTQRPPGRSMKKSQTYNDEWGVQDKGVMILQHLPKELIGKANRLGQFVFFSKSLKLLEKEGWVFAEAEQAYCGVKVARGKTKLRPPAKEDFRNGEGGPEIGTFLDLADFQSPIVFEVSAKSKYRSFEAFQDDVMSNQLVMKDDILTYASKSYKTKITFYSDYSRLPVINGGTLNLNPDFVYKSPFINGRFGAGIVTITSDDKKQVYDFNQAR